MMRINCASCGVPVDLPDKVGFRDTCPSCHAYLHSCVNCAFLVDSRCTEPSAEKVRDPEGINFCEWYREREKGQGKREKTGGRDEAEELWKKLTKK